MAHKSCIVVGAGVCGLLAARQLRQAGFQVVVLEAEDRAGGRMSTSRVHGASFDTGAQFFAARDERFKSIVGEWIRQGIAAEWCRGFESGDGVLTPDGLPRFRGAPNMAAIPSALSEGQELYLNAPVASACYDGRAWRVVTMGGEEHRADALLLTPPAPLSVEILDAGKADLPAPARALLGAIEFDPCFALLVLLDGPSKVPRPGGLRMAGDPIAWIADNRQKGVEAERYCVTIHSGSNFTRDSFDADDDLVTTLMLGPAHQWFGANVLQTSLLRWRYSQPLRIHPRPCIAVTQPGMLVFAGDAFGGPRIEGAALSGLAAADVLIEALEG